MKTCLAWIATCCLLISLSGHAEDPTQLAPAKTSQPAIPYKQNPPTEDLLIKVVGGLLVAGLAGIGLALAIRRFLPGFTGSLPGNRGLIIKEKIRLSTTSQLIVVLADNDELLLAEGPHGVQLLRSKPRPPVPTDIPHA